VLTSRVILGGRYELDARLGAGGFSEVWRAADLTLGRPVAVKLLYAGYAQHEETLARFRAEGRHAGRLSHENIARVYDFGEPAGDQPPYLVMELIDGPSLAGLLRDGPLSPQRTARILAQAAAGLAAAHAAGLVHRDIKPGNLLIGPGGEVKITDFGIARTRDSAPLTGTGLLIGTPGYLAPERAAGSPATPAADVYALGIVGYECLAGCPPFTGTPLEVVQAHGTEPLPALPPGAPADLAALIGQLTARQPAARPASAVVARLADQIASREAAAPAGAAAGATLVQPVPMPSSLPGAGAGADDPVTAQLTQLPGAPPEPAARRPGAGRRLVLGLAAAALAVAGGLAAASQIGGPAGQPGASGPPSQSPGTHPAAAGAALVRVRAAALIGRPVAVVARELRQRGLVVQVRWQRSAAEPPRTVLEVLPAGRLPAGSHVVVIGALRPPGHDQGRGNGDGGHGNGGGPGNGGGNGDGGHGNGGGSGDGGGQGNGGGQGQD
jgi:serine/threonine-protein kinase